MLQKRYGCPVEVTVEVIGGKWKCTILWWLRQGSKRFSELMQLIPAITRKVLTNQLRELEADGLIRREVYRETPRRVEYSLTPQGETLRPITELMCEWGKAKMPGFQFGLMKLEGLRILVVAQESDICEQLHRELASARKANVTVVATPPERLSEIQPDVVVVDLAASDKDFSALQLLEAELGKQIPAIALTARTEDRRIAFSQGFRVLLAKPVEPAELVAAIATLTGRLG